MELAASKRYLDTAQHNRDLMARVASPGGQLDQMQTRIEALEDVLGPFAEFAEWLDGEGGWQDVPDDRVLCRWAKNIGGAVVWSETRALTVGDVRAARALSTSEGAEG